MRRMAIACATVFCVTVACTGGPEREPNATPSTSPIPRGGTLRVGVVRIGPDAPGFSNELWGSAALDPSLTLFIDSGELFRCCLARTLLSYPGRPTRQDGGILQPDLAAGMPEVSPDGLTWTFRLRPGLRYGPPLEDVEIRSQDFIRALERATQSPNSYLFSVVEGFDAFTAGEADRNEAMELPRLALKRSSPLGGHQPLPRGRPAGPSVGTKQPLVGARRVSGV